MVTLTYFFEGKIFYIFISLERWELAQKCETIVTFDICHRMVPLLKLYSMTLIYILRSKS